MVVSELTKKDFSYLKDMYEGVKEKRCSMCQRKIKDNQDCVWSTCTEWEKAHTCRTCYFGIYRAREYEKPDEVLEWDKPRPCPVCGGRNYNPNYQSYCFDCHYDKEVDECGQHGKKPKFPDILGYEDRTEKDHQKLRDYWTEVNRREKEIEDCDNCYELRIKYLQPNISKYICGPWNKDWCWRCGGLDRWPNEQRMHGHLNRGYQFEGLYPCICKDLIIEDW